MKPVKVTRLLRWPSCMNGYASSYRYVPLPAFIDSFLRRKASTPIVNVTRMGFLWLSNRHKWLVVLVNDLRLSSIGVMPVDCFSHLSKQEIQLSLMFTTIRIGTLSHAYWSSSRNKGCQERGINSQSPYVALTFSKIALHSRGDSKSTSGQWKTWILHIQSTTTHADPVTALLIWNLADTFCASHFEGKGPVLDTACVKRRATQRIKSHNSCDVVMTTSESLL